MGFSWDNALLLTLKQLYLHSYSNCISSSWKCTLLCLVVVMGKTSQLWGNSKIMNVWAFVRNYHKGAQRRLDAHWRNSLELFWHTVFNLDLPHISHSQSAHELSDCICSWWSRFAGWSLSLLCCALRVVHSWHLWSALFPPCACLVILGNVLHCLLVVLVFSFSVSLSLWTESLGR